MIPPITLFLLLLFPCLECCACSVSLSWCLVILPTAIQAGVSPRRSSLMPRLGQVPHHLLSWHPAPIGPYGRQCCLSAVLRLTTLSVMRTRKACEGPCLSTALSTEPGSHWCSVDTRTGKRERASEPRPSAWHCTAPAKCCLAPQGVRKWVRAGDLPEG